MLKQDINLKRHLMIKKLTREKKKCPIHTISLVIICLLLLVVISISCYYYKRNMHYRI